MFWSARNTVRVTAQLAPTISNKMLALKLTMYYVASFVITPTYFADDHACPYLLVSGYFYLCWCPAIQTNPTSSSWPEISNAQTDQDLHRIKLPKT